MTTTTCFSYSGLLLAMTAKSYHVHIACFLCDKPLITQDRREMSSLRNSDNIA